MCLWLTIDTMELDSTLATFPGFTRREFSMPLDLPVSNLTVATMCNLPCLSKKVHRLRTRFARRHWRTPGITRGSGAVLPQGECRVCDWEMQSMRASTSLPLRSLAARLSSKLSDEIRPLDDRTQSNKVGRGLNTHFHYTRASSYPHMTPASNY